MIPHLLSTSAEAWTTAVLRRFGTFSNFPACFYTAETKLIWTFWTFQLQRSDLQFPTVWRMQPFLKPCQNAGKIKKHKKRTCRTPPGREMGRLIRFSPPRGRVIFRNGATSTVGSRFWDKSLPTSSNYCFSLWALPAQNESHQEVERAHLGRTTQAGHFYRGPFVVDSPVMSINSLLVLS